MAAKVEALARPAQAPAVLVQLFVADWNLRTDPHSSPSGAPSAAPWRGADTRGAIGAWSPTGAPNVNGAPLAAPSEAGADVGGTADGLTIPDEEDGAERSGERSRTSYDSGSTSCTS